jgi:catechol 2,3-dioxygenase-like lactoylglutathione lyase family enzyme
MKITGIAETSLYVDDLARTAAFYRRLFDLTVLLEEERLVALEVAPGQVLLLFLRHASLTPVVLDFGTFPSHDGNGPLHVCFGIAPEDLAAWRQRLEALSIAIESRIDWPGGAVSLYFRDPDGHAVELATPGIWSHLPKQKPKEQMK